MWTIVDESTDPRSIGKSNSPRRRAEAASTKPKIARLAIKNRVLYRACAGITRASRRSTAPDGAVAVTSPQKGQRTSLRSTRARHAGQTFCLYVTDLKKLLVCS